jgi:hypothetical protein
MGVRCRVVCLESEEKEIFKIKGWSFTSELIVGIR